MQHVIAMPVSVRTLRDATAIAGTLGKPSKMPGMSYGISAKLCNVGAKLAKIAGSVCHGCYALKANYSYPSVMKAHIKRADSLYADGWVNAMVLQITKSKTEYFRWHDSGDLQSLQHLLNIVAVAEALPNVQFWLPTREKKIVNTYIDTFGAVPANLIVRVSAAMIDADAPMGFTNTSTVHDKRTEVVGFECKAYLNNNKCGDCRACWNRDVANVSYRKH